MVKKSLGHQKWLEIEEEYKSEIGAAQYNKKGWMENKPKLYKIINKKMKAAPKAKLAPIASNESGEHLESDEETLIEMEDGCILQVRPKFRGADQTWKRNFTKKFNLQQSGNNRWAQKPNRFPPRNGNGNAGGNNNNQNGQNQRNNRGDGPTADQIWKCRLCQNEGKGVKKYRGDQQCPKHKYRPKFFNPIKLAAVRQISTEDQDEPNDGGDDHLAAMNSINAIMFGNESD